jgi:hypothetical protein
MSSKSNLELDISSTGHGEFESSFPIRPPRKKISPDKLKQNYNIELTETKSKRTENNLASFFKTFPSTAVEKLRSGFWNLVCLLLFDFHFHLVKIET